MSILRVAASPADINIGGYDFLKDGVGYDASRVTGCFFIDNTRSFEVEFAEASGTSTWFHARVFHSVEGSFQNGSLFFAHDSDNNTLAQIDFTGRSEYLEVYGDTTFESPSRTNGFGTFHLYDLHLEVTSTEIIGTYYLNGIRIATGTVANTVGEKGKPNRVVFNTATGSGLFISEIIIADEDTRGMRIRELRPQSFGVFQDWDGNIQSLRDDDIATGLSTDTADRRASFGVSNLSNIQEEDLINRVVVQSYAQRGVSGLSAFNHFFRFSDGTVEDGDNITLTTIGSWAIEEFLQNPDTVADWEAADFAGIQTGIRSRA